MVADTWPEKQDLGEKKGMEEVGREGVELGWKEVK